jgi:cyclophilin family peptidyl-prolyl cis-trans isomerase
LEVLEDRSLLSSGAFGTLSGFAFIDANGNGARDASERPLSGASVNLTGTTSGGFAVNLSSTTDVTGQYLFQNLLPGTYQVRTSVSGLQGGPSFGGQVGSVVSPSVALGAGQSVSQDAGFLGFAAQSISLRLFLNTTTTASLPFTFAGNDSAPVVSTPISAVSVAQNSSDTNIDLAGNFSDPNTTPTLVRFDTTAGPIDVQLSDNQAPRTVANFLNYITSGRYDNSIFHRLVPNFVLQGGGFSLQVDPNTNKASLPSITADPAVTNEFGVSNTAGTLAMALTGSDVNSATDEFFFNLVNNSSSLDPQSFTVFGKIVGPTSQQVINALAATPQVPQSSPFDQIPLNNYDQNDPNFPANTSAANYILVQDAVVVNRNEALTYSVVNNTNAGLVTATITNNRLDLHYTANATGTAVITVQATDRFGATTTTSFNVTVQ